MLHNRGTDDPYGTSAGEITISGKRGALSDDGKLQKYYLHELGVINIPACELIKVPYLVCMDSQDSSYETRSTLASPRE